MPITHDDLYRWLYDHYAEHMTNGAIDIGSLEAALAKDFKGTPNPMLNDFVVNFCLNLQEAAQAELRKRQLP